jgi:ribosomal protein S20
LANTKQQRKRVKIAAREHGENIRYKSHIKTMFRSLSVTADEDQEKAVEMALELNSLIDRAAGHGILHENNAARKKAKVAAMVTLPEGTGLAKGPEKTEASEGNANKAEKRIERGKARHKKKVEARASAKARAAAVEEEASAKTETDAAEAAPAEEAAEEAAAEPEADEAHAEAEEAPAEPEAEAAAAEEAPAEAEAEAAPAEEAAVEPDAEEAEEAPTKE